MGVDQIRTADFTYYLFEKTGENSFKKTDIGKELTQEKTLGNYNYINRQELPEIESIKFGFSYDGNN